MTRSDPRAATRRAAAALVALLCVGAFACATTPLAQRDWISLRTAHYDVLSSLSDAETKRLASELEGFRAGAEFLWGSALPATSRPTRVYAFDDRGVGRPFSYRSNRSYLLPRQRGDVIVLRTGGGWEGDATLELKLEYARRLYWNASPDPLPPWFEEGMAQLASTLEIRGAAARVGAPRSDHLAMLQQSQWITFGRMLGAPDLVGWSPLDRSLLEAESWALCHDLVLSKPRRDDSGAGLARFRNLLRGGSGPLEATRRAFGGESELEREVFDSVRANKFDMLVVPIPSSDTHPVIRAVPSQEITEELARLALAIGERDQAARWLERSLEQGAGSARAMAAMGDVLEAGGDADGADAFYRSALEAAPEDPIVQLGFGELLQSRAAATTDPARRVALLAPAREHYQRAIELAPDLPEAYAGLAATFLVDGEDPAAGLAAARTAGTLLPGDTGILMLEARLALGAGDRETARRQATLSLSRARSRSEIEAARSLLDRIDAHAALRGPSQAAALPCCARVAS